MTAIEAIRERLLIAERTPLSMLSPRDRASILNDALTLLTEVDRQAKALRAARERCWSLCGSNEVHGRVFEHRDECNECGMTRAEYEHELNPELQSPAEDE